MDLVVELPSGRGNASCKYRSVAKLGGGSFGDILAAVNESDPHDWIALKIEARYRANDMERKRAEPSMVRFEQLVCRELARGAGLDGSGRRTRNCPCPVVRGCVSLHGEQDVLAMELVGPNLRDYATALGRWPLPEDLVLVLGAALVGRLQQLHACGFVHRDLKPENLVLRLERSQDEGVVPCLLFVDSMAMRFSRPGGAGHIPEREDDAVAGTHRYMAVHAQRGVTQSRRSDLESLAHVLVFLALGQLPWQQHQDVTEMLQRKERTPVAELCAELRPAFAAFLRRCRELRFEEEPDYDLLQRTLLEGVNGPIDFEAARVRRDFKQHLQEAYLQHQASHAAAARLPPVGTPVGALRSMLPIFARHDKRCDATELVACQPMCAADLDDPQSFFFEGYREPLSGTTHVVVGSCHFFGFLREEALAAAHAEASLDAGAAEQVLVFSQGRRDWVARAAQADRKSVV